MSGLSTILANLAERQQLFTLEWERVSDDVPTRVTCNGIAEKHKKHGSYIWRAKNGEDYLIMRGRIVSSDNRTEARADGIVRENVSDAGADGQWHYWTVKVASIRRLLAMGLVIETN